MTQLLDDFLSGNLQQDTAGIDIPLASRRPAQQDVGGGSFDDFLRRKLQAPAQQNFLDPAVEQRPVDLFDPKLIRVSGIKGFEGEERTGSVAENFGLDLHEIIEAYGMLGSALMENPLETAKEIGANFVPAMVQSYTRWAKAAENGVFLDAVKQYPLQAIQDLTLPISLIASGGATGLGVAGKGASSVARAARTVAKYSDILGIASDPIGGTIGVGGRKLGGIALKKMVGRSARESAQEAGRVIERVSDFDKPTRLTPEDIEIKLIAGGVPQDAIASRTKDIFESQGKKFELPEGSKHLEAAANEFLKVDPMKYPKSKRLAGNINLERLNSPEDFKRWQTFIIEGQNKGFWDSRRGVVPKDQVEAAAQASIDSGRAVTELNARKYGEAFNAEQITATRMLVEDSKNEMMSRAVDIQGGNNSDVNLTKFHQSYTRYVALQDELAGVTAEAGRALQSFRNIPKEVRLQEKILKDILVSSGGRAKLEKMAQQLTNVKNPARFAQDAFKATSWDKFMEAWINGLLSGPQTQIVNTTSNAGLLALVQGVENLGATAISKIPKFGSGKLSLEEAVGKMAGIGKGMNESWKKGFATFMSEQSPDIMGQLELPIKKAIGSGPDASKLAKVVGQTVRLPGRTLEGTDIFFKMLNYSSEMRGLAIRKANELIKSGKLKPEGKAKFIDDTLAQPPAKMNDIAWEVARKNTFTNALGGDWLTDLGAWVQQGARKNKILRVMVPFVRTPTNIAKFALERTPFGVTFGDVRKNLFGPRGVARDQAWSRMILGTTGGTMAAMAASQGMITGGAPSDNREKQLKRTSGWQEYSIKVGDNYFSYGRIEPAGVIMGLASDFVRLSDVLTNGEIEKAPALIASSFAKNMASKTFLRGFTDAVNAFNDPDRYAERYAQNLFASVVPFSSMLATVARANDPYMRQSTSIFERAQARGNLIYGPRDELPLVRNIWGDKIEFEQGDLARAPFAGKYFDDLPDKDKSIVRRLAEKTFAAANPIYMRADKKDKVTNSMLKMGYFPGMPSRKLLGVDLTGEQYSKLVELSGQSAKALLDKYAATDEWDNALNGSPTDVLDLERQVDSIIRSYRRDAELKIRELFPELEIKIQQEQLRRTGQI